LSHILKVIAQRIALGFLTLFTISLLITFGVELLPGDLAESILGQGATPETVIVFRVELGLDKPAHMRYLSWLGGIVTGDLGVSLANKREISELVGIRIANTLFLGGFAAAIAVPLALFLGILAALYRNTLYDRGHQHLYSYHYFISRILRCLYPDSLFCHQAGLVSRYFQYQYGVVFW